LPNFLVIAEGNLRFFCACGKYPQEAVAVPAKKQPIPKKLSKMACQVPSHPGIQLKLHKISHFLTENKFAKTAKQFCSIR